MEEQYTRREISYALSALTDVEYEIIKDMKIDGIYKALSSRENLDQSLDLCSITKIPLLCIKPG